MTRSNRARRAFLRTLGTAACGLPFLPGAWSRAGKAQPVAAPKRLLVVFTHNQMPPAYWLPTGGGETDFVANEILRPLEPHRDRLLQLHGLHSDIDDHKAAKTTLTDALAGGTSVDQLVAAHLGNATRMRSLELGCFSNKHAISYSGPNLAVPPILHPRAAYDRVVAAAFGDPAVQQLRAAQTGSVLDTVAGQYAELGRRLAPTERRLVDAHLQSLRDLERRIEDPAPVAACAMPPLPAVEPGTAPLMDDARFPDVARDHMDVIAAAFRCDVTRVATLLLGSGGSTVRYQWLGIAEGAHDVAHGFVNATDATIANAPRQWADIQVWHAEQIAYLVGQLDVPDSVDGATSILDNTAVVWVSELGLAQHTHRRSDLPVTIVGGCGGYLRAGRFLDLGGRPYADFLRTLVDAMDAPLAGAPGTAILDELRA